ncbi:MAG: hypothetical protein LBD90_00220, partial [Bifidobacteriaceae bacterium]|nr:hypothetical protein [Bifidobacteriaceae bacterium]
MTRRTVRPLGAGAAGLLGAGTGLAIVTIVWGAAWVWSGQPETGPAASSPPASTAEASPSSPWPAAPSRPQATPSASATAVETQAAGRAQATSPAPAPTPVPTPPVPVRATVAYEVATKGDVAADFDI